MVCGFWVLESSRSCRGLGFWRRPRGRVTTAFESAEHRGTQELVPNLLLGLGRLTPIVSAGEYGRVHALMSVAAGCMEAVTATSTAGGVAPRWRGRSKAPNFSYSGRVGHVGSMCRARRPRRSGHLVGQRQTCPGRPAWVGLAARGEALSTGTSRRSTVLPRRPGPAASTRWPLSNVTTTRPTPEQTSSPRWTSRDQPKHQPHTRVGGSMTQDGQPLAIRSIDHEFSGCPSR
jgi:hypothetical protein